MTVGKFQWVRYGTARGSRCRRRTGYLAVFTLQDTGPTDNISSSASFSSSSFSIVAR